jgi:hypothetical protein
MKINYHSFTLIFSICFLNLIPTTSSRAQSITCIANGQDAHFIQKSTNAVPVVLAGQSEACNHAYSFELYKKNLMQGVLTLAPEEIGLHAKNILYWVSFRTGRAREIGELPISATKINKFIYADTSQEGALCRLVWNLTSKASV